MTAAERGYFAAADGGKPVAAPRVVDLDATERYDLAPGIRVRAAVGEDCMMNLVEFERGGEAPMHAHAEEQLVLVMEGEVRMRIDGEARVLRSGHVAVIPSWVPHGAVGESERALTIEVFSPPRAALLELLEAAGRGFASSDG
jgi:quercetin dioxygenase-like cupin family protein